MKRLFKHEENTDIISKRRNKKIFQKRNEEKEIFKIGNNLNGKNNSK